MPAKNWGLRNKMGRQKGGTNKLPDGWLDDFIELKKCYGRATTIKMLKKALEIFEE